MVTKKISWDGDRWVCEEFKLTVKYTIGNQEHIVPILAEDVSFQSDPAWLQMGAPEVQPDHSLIVPINVKDDARISPPAGTPVEYRTSDSEEDLVPAPPAKPLKVKVSISVAIRPGNLMEMPVWGIPIAMPFQAGLGKIPLNTIPPLPPLKGTVTYEVEPPQVKWEAPPDDFRVRLSGKKDETQSVELHGGKNLPPGWLNSANIVFVIRGKSSKLELSLGSRPLDCEEGELARVVEFVSSKLCLVPVKDTGSEDTNHAPIEFAIATSSPFLGTQVQEMNLKAQALEVALFFEDASADKLDWSRRAPLAIVTQALENNPSILSQLRVWLKYTSGWDPPAVHWELREDDSLGDRFAPPDAAESMYVAPLRDPWIKADRPTNRTVLCLVGEGNGREPEPVPEHDKLFFYLPIESTVLVGERRQRIHLRVRIRPSRLRPNELDLNDPRVIESFIREFDVEIN
jgi:hypothetical protein